MPSDRLDRNQQLVAELRKRSAEAVDRSVELVRAGALAEARKEFTDAVWLHRLTEWFEETARDGEMPGLSAQPGR